MNTAPRVDDNKDEIESPMGWDAFSVWSERVCKPDDRAPIASAQGWDPYFVWLSRVRKSDQ
jgi:hypothetical protein